MSNSNGTGSHPPGKLRGLWRSVRGLFGDPVVRDRLGQVADALGADVQVTAERVRVETVAQGESTRQSVREQADGTRLTVREQADDLRSRIADVRGGVVEVGTRVGALHTPVTDVHAGLAEVRAKVGDLRPVIEHQAEATRQSADARAHELIQAIEFQAVVTRTAVGEVQRLADQCRQMVAGWHLDPWRLDELEGLLRYVRRRDYDEAVRGGRLVMPKLDTAHPIAVYSDDTKHPRGSRNDNSVVLRFNRKLIGHFGGRPLRVLDLGCAGGGMVRSFLDAGHFAVGLDGSDYPLVNQTGEWATIPHHLFTCDVTRPFRLTDAATGEPLRFDAITGWELMEHIPEERLDGLLANLDAHLTADGLICFSIATFVDHDPAIGAVYHVCVHPKEWWVERFARGGFVEATAAPFGPYDWVRGSGHCRGDWTEDQGLGFHLALRRK